MKKHSTKLYIADLGSNPSIYNNPEPNISTMTAGIALAAPRTASHTRRLVGFLLCLFFPTTNNKSKIDGSIASLNANALM